MTSLNRTTTDEEIRRLDRLELRSSAPREDSTPRPLARHLYDRWLEQYDGPEFPSIEEFASIELCHVTDDEFEEAVEEAERLKAIDSYVSAFGKRPRLTANGWPRR